MDKDPPLGRDGLEALCSRYNAERARRGIDEVYGIDRSGHVWSLYAYIPDTIREKRKREAMDAMRARWASRPARAGD